MNKADKAKELFEGGCNCCQAVFCAFLDENKMSMEDALRLSAGFGGGFGRLREVCGAVSGMTMVLSENFASSDPNDHEKKAALYKLIQEAAGKFKEENQNAKERPIIITFKRNNQNFITSFESRR